MFLVSVISVFAELASLFWSRQSVPGFGFGFLLIGCLLLFFSFSFLDSARRGRAGRGLALD